MHGLLSTGSNLRGFIREDTGLKMTFSKTLLWSGGIAVLVLLFLFGLYASKANAYVGTYTDVTASRALNTVYQNTSTEDLYVNVSVKNNSGSTFTYQILIGPSSSPADVASSHFARNFNNNADYPLWSVVPPGYYYTVSASGAVSAWWEYETPAMTGGGGTGLSTDPVQNALLAAFLVLYTANYVRRLFYS